MGEQFEFGYDKAQLDKIQEERGYSYEDEVFISECAMSDYHEKV